MTRDEQVLNLALDTYEARMETDAHLPLTERKRAARAAARRVVRSWAPGAVAHIERNQPPTEHDETARPRLRKRARLMVEAVAKEATAATGGDVTPELLTGLAAYPWLASWRDLCWWRLSREGMTTREIALVFGRGYSGIAKGIRRHEVTVRALVAGVAAVARG